MSEDTSNIYTEHQLIDIFDASFVDSTDDMLEQELTALLQLIDIAKQDTRLVSSEHILHLLEITHSAEGLTDWTTKWIKNMSIRLAGDGIPKFIEGLRYVTEHAGTFMKGLQLELKNKSVSEKYIHERFDQIKTRIEKYQKMKRLYVTGPSYEKQTGRFAGIIDMCKSILDMAEKGDNESFASDRIWDSLASASNNVVKAEEPKPGSTFRRFVWNKPIYEEFDIKSSDWNKDGSVQDMRDLVLKVKYDAFDILIKAAKLIQEQCKGLESEVEHVRNDNYELVARKYARAYVVSKLVQSVQGIIMKEINFFCTTGINKLGKFNMDK